MCCTSCTWRHGLAPRPSGLHGVLPRGGAEVGVSYACMVCAIMVIRSSVARCRVQPSMACRCVRCYDNHSRLLVGVSDTQDLEQHEEEWHGGNFPQPGSVTARLYSSSPSPHDRRAWANAGSRIL